MASKLTKKQLKALKDHCELCDMQGKGVMDVLKSIGKHLAPIAKKLGPKLLKKVVIPFLKKKLVGKGLDPAGNGLRLAGQRGRGKKKLPHMVKGSKAAKEHMAKLRAMRRK